MVSAGNGRKITGCYKNGNSEQVKEIFIKIREENLGKIHLSANGGKVVISGITSTLIRMCNNMAESMETEQLLEKVQTEQSFPKALEVLETQFLRLCEENYHSRSRKSEIYYQKLEEYLEKIMAIHLWASPWWQKSLDYQKTIFLSFSRRRWENLLVAIWKN